MDKKAIIGQRVFKGVKYLAVVLWAIVAILVVILIGKIKTLNIGNINKTTIEVFGEGNALELEDGKILVSAKIPKNNKAIAVEKARDYVYKLNKYKNKQYNTLILIVGFQTTFEQKDIILTANIDLNKIKSTNWSKMTKYEDVVDELCIKFSSP